MEFLGGILLVVALLVAFGLGFVCAVWLDGEPEADRHRHKTFTLPMQYGTYGRPFPSPEYTLTLSHIDPLCGLGKHDIASTSAFVHGVQTTFQSCRRGCGWSSWRKG